MRKLVMPKQQYKLNDGKWTDTTCFNTVQYKEEADFATNTVLIESWDEAFKFVNNRELINARTDYTLFKHRPYLWLPDLDSDCKIKVFENDFKSLEVKIVYEPYKCTMRELADRLSADEFCQYLKDKGVALSI